MSPSAHRTASLHRVLWRGLRRRCPRCGVGNQFRRWFVLHDRCPHCRLEFEPKPGDTWAFWIVGDRIFIAVAIALLYFGVQPESWMGRGVFLALTITAIVLTMPQRQGVCTALDFYLRMRGGEDGV